MRTIFIASLLGLFAPATAAQTIPVGTWTGTITLPDGTMDNVTYDVTMQGDTLRISIVHESFGSFPFRNIMVMRDRITFGWEPGEPVDCVLMLKESGRYEGECLDAGGASGRLEMIPPSG